MTDRLYFLGACGFAVGILWESLSPIPLPAIGFVCFIGVLVGVSYVRTKRRTYLVLGVAVVLCAVGMLRVSLAPSALPPDLAARLDTEVTLTGVVVVDPDIRETTQRITIATEHTKVLAVAPLYPAISYGEKVTVSGHLVRPEPFDTNGGRTFDYDRFLAKDGIFALVERASVEVEAPRSGIVPHILGAFTDLKNTFLRGIAAALPEPESSLAGGLVAGGKQGLGERLLNAFIVSGLVHIVVLSGYNVMIVADAVMRACSFFSRRIAAIAAGVAIGAFVLAAGAGAASIRAGLMAGIALFARATYRTYDAVRALIFAGLLMLLWNPLLLAYDPGFQLSFVATLGLILGTPIVEQKLTFIRNAFFKEIAASTIAAQIAVLPLLLYQNGLFSVVALPANLLVLPVVPLAMLLSGIAGVAGMIVPAIAPLIGLPAYVLLGYIVTVVEYVAALPIAAFFVPQFPFVVVILAYAGMGYLLWRHPITHSQTVRPQPSS